MLLKHKEKYISLKMWILRVFFFFKFEGIDQMVLYTKTDLQMQKNGFADAKTYKYFIFLRI